MSANSECTFLCGSTSAPNRKHKYRSAQSLEWRKNALHAQNIELQLPRFVDQVLHIPDRTLDLLEIASYIYCADRLSYRGKPEAVEYHSWSRSFELVIPVRDHSFWISDVASTALERALCFMTGDRGYSFTFVSGHSTPPSQLFDLAQAPTHAIPDSRVLLFSGGLDSLAGAIDTLSEDAVTACLVSHYSQHGTMKTQRALARSLKEYFPSRTVPFGFKCQLKNASARDETQRSRSFLYYSIAYAIACAQHLDHFHVYENGYTAMAFPERLDLLNARASRTTHPKTNKLMAELFTHIGERDFKIVNPYQWNTKADIIKKVGAFQNADLLTSAVSCSATRTGSDLARQCGVCSQCIERRLAAYASDLAEIDNTCSYAADFVIDSTAPPVPTSFLTDYIRQSVRFSKMREEAFATEYVSDLSQIVEGIEGMDEYETVGMTWKLCRRHGFEIVDALRKLQIHFDDPALPAPTGYLFEIIKCRDYLRLPAEVRTSEIFQILRRALPTAFQSQPPANEKQLNDQIQGLLQAMLPDYHREFPKIAFGISSSIPDHSIDDDTLFVEGKYVKKKTSLASITDQMAADTLKYGKKPAIAFVVYDRDRRISDDDAFIKSLVSERVFVTTIR